MATQPLLSMRHIQKHYGPVCVVSDGCLEVARGEVHALLGANGAGKSTMMRVLCGEIDFTSGSIEFDCQPLDPIAAGKPEDHGIVMIHQELCVVPALTVAQYIFLGREPMDGLRIDDQRMSTDAEELLAQAGADFGPDTPMSALSVARQQLVEIARAASFDMRLLILDEPTTSLGERETEHLFTIVRRLKERGVSVILITHRLEKVFALTDRITVMRDGRTVQSLRTADTDMPEVIRLLAGRELSVQRKRQSSVLPDADVVLEVEGLATTGQLHDISFSLRRGEVLGLAGLVGSGRTETARAICGIDARLRGDIRLQGKTVSISSPRDAISSGICYLSEDRNEEGVVAARSIVANTTLASLGRYERHGLLSDADMQRDALDYNGQMHTKYDSLHDPVSSLSGGNRQKVVIAKWLIRDPQVLIFDEPTKGIDVGARDEIYQIIADIARNGHAVILISSETDELLLNCDRILVMHEGAIAGELSIEEASEETIMLYAHGGKS